MSIENHSTNIEEKDEGTKSNFNIILNIQDDLTFNDNYDLGDNFINSLNNKEKSYTKEELNKILEEGGVENNKIILIINNYFEYKSIRLVSQINLKKEKAHIESLDEFNKLSDLKIPEMLSSYDIYTDMGEFIRKENLGPGSVKKLLIEKGVSEFDINKVLNYIKIHNEIISKNVDANNQLNIEQQEAGKETYYRILKKYNISENINDIYNSIEIRKKVIKKLESQINNDDLAGKELLSLLKDIQNREEIVIIKKQQKIDYIKQKNNNGNKKTNKKNKNNTTNKKTITENGYFLTTKENYNKSGSLYNLTLKNGDKIEGLTEDEKDNTLGNSEALKNLVQFKDKMNELNLGFVWKFRKDLIDAFNNKNISNGKKIDITDNNYINKKELNSLLNFILEITGQEGSKTSIYGTYAKIIKINGAGVLNNKKNTNTSLSPIGQIFYENDLINLGSSLTTENIINLQNGIIQKK